MLIGLSVYFWNTIPGNSGYSAYIWRSMAVMVSVTGIALRCATIGRIPRGTSGRNTKRQKASVLNTTGAYSLVRNPLYLGNALIWIGITLFFEEILLTAIFTLLLLVYYLFVVYAEEDFLSEQFGEKYASYAKQTPALIPRLKRWIPSDRPFSWLMVLRREHDSIFSAVTGIVIVYHCMDYRTHSGQILLRREWLIPWLVLAGLWLILKVLKKKTRLLSIPRESVLKP